MNVIETELYCKKGLTDKNLIDAYHEGKAAHAFSIMRAIYRGAVVDKKERLLIWLAETSLKKHIDAQVETNVFSAMTPEQRREEIRKLTKKCALNG